jgi:methionine-rich copper-binding protein CopC
MIIKAFVIFLMATIAYALFSAAHYVTHASVDDNKTVKALTWRIGLSFSLFFFLFAAFALGWLNPHGLA